MTMASSGVREPVAITDKQDLDFVISPDALRPDDRILVPRGLLGAACDAINKKRDAPKTLAELRRYAFGYLSSPAPAPNALDAAFEAVRKQLCKLPKYSFI